MKSFKYILPVAVFALILFGLSARGMIAEEKTYSTIEKRELQTMPKIRVKAIKKGTFQKKYETYLSDQFPGRDTWVQVQTDASRLMGNRFRLRDKACEKECKGTRKPCERDRG